MKVRDVAKKTKRAHEQQAILVEQKKQEALELRKKQKDEEEELTKARREEEYAEEMIREYEMKKHQAMESFGDEGHVLARMVNGLTSTFLGTRMFGEDLKTQEQKIRMWKEKKLEALKCLEERRIMREEAYEKLADFDVKIGKCTGEKELAYAAVDALHEAVDRLQMLAALVMQASVFWKQMQEHCKTLVEEQMKETIEKAMKFDDARRKELRIFRGFKQKVVRFYAGWVALNDACGEYLLAIHKTRRDFYRYITKMPTYEEAEANVETLAAKLKSDLGGGAESDSKARI